MLLWIQDANIEMDNVSVNKNILKFTFVYVYINLIIKSLSGTTEHWSFGISSSLSHSPPWIFTKYLTYNLSLYPKDNIGV